MPYQQNDWGGNALDNYLIGKVGRREFCIAWCSSAEAQWWGPPCWVALPAGLRCRHHWSHYSAITRTTGDSRPQRPTH